MAGRERNLGGESEKVASAAPGGRGTSRHCRLKGLYRRGEFRPRRNRPPWGALRAPRKRCTQCTLWEETFAARQAVAQAAVDLAQLFAGDCPS